MKLIAYLFMASSILLSLLVCQAVGKSKPPKNIRICYAKNASFQEQLAAKELRRYIYLRTGELYETQTVSSVPVGGNLIVVSVKGSELLKVTAFDVANLAEQEYSLKTIDDNDRKVVVISGGDSIAVLYGAYHFIEKLGIRFHLHGDVIPDKKIAFTIPQLDETHKPVFKLRGILPFHDFSEGPDWWNKDDYKAYFDQMVKMRMNFIGLHTYPGWGAEPHLWIGLPEDCKENGEVTDGHATGYANTMRNGAWNYSAMKTGDFSGGAHLIFPHDVYGSEIQGKYLPRPANKQESIEQFNHAGKILKDVFVHRKKLGIKLCLGNQVPLWMPPNVQTRLKSIGLNPNSDEAIKKVYRGMFKWVKKMYDSDYFWLWTTEGWVLNPPKKSDIDQVVTHIKIAADALQEVATGTGLATCGWTVGPPGDLAGFDRILPEDSSIGSINRNVGFAPVEPDFAKIKRCDTWVIPWLEDDPAMVEPQLWAGRIRRDAYDAYKYGVDGLFGIHWRTRILSPQLKALAEAGWTLPSKKDVESVRKEVGSAKEAKIIEDYSDGGTVASTTASVAGTELDAVYQSVRYNLNAYNIRVPNGTYKVTLHFCETHYTAPGKRIFDVNIQSNKLVDKLDIFAQAGKLKAFDLSFEGIVIDSGKLLLDFPKHIEYPSIAGITINGVTTKNMQFAGRPFTRKINCGGSVFADFEGDLKPKAALPLVNCEDMPVRDLYTDWVKTQFGTNAPQALIDIFVKYDGGPRTRTRDQWFANLPRISNWNGPGAIFPQAKSWKDEISLQFAFVDELKTIRSSITTPGALERYDYWLNTFKYQRQLGHLSCIRGQLDKIIGSIRREKNAAKIKERVEKEALPLRIALSRSWEKMMTYMLQTVTNPSELGTIANLEQHSRKNLNFVKLHDSQMEKWLGKNLPADIQLSRAYTGAARIIVPSKRTLIEVGEALNLKVIILDQNRPKEAVLCWRILGEDRYQKIPLSHIARGVYNVTLPEIEADFEYYIEVESIAGKKLIFPTTAPEINQAVVVMPE